MELKDILDYAMRNGKVLRSIRVHFVVHNKLQFISPLIFNLGWTRIIFYQGIKKQKY